MNPNVFHRANGKSAVYSQPQGGDEQLSAMQAAVACPTGSIRTEHRSALARTASESFPLIAKDTHGRDVPGVYFNGFTSPHTFGALSWLIIHPSANVLVDCPRFSESLAKRIIQLAQPHGISYIMLTHRDDVHDNHRWAERLQAKRIIHTSECSVRQHTDDCEIQLNDEDFPYKLSESLRIIHVPGHSRGSIALLDSSSQSLFAGDHIYASSGGQISASTRYCSYNWQIQCDSIEKLANLPFLHIWPGHGSPHHFIDDDDRAQSIVSAASELRQRA